MARLTAPNGTTVEVDDSKVDGLVRRGFTEDKPKAPAKKSASSKSEK